MVQPGIVFNVEIPTVVVKEYFEGLSKVERARSEYIPSTFAHLAEGLSQLNTLISGARLSGCPVFSHSASGPADPLAKFRVPSDFAERLSQQLNEEAPIPEKTEDNQNTQFRDQVLSHGVDVLKSLFESFSEKNTESDDSENKDSPKD